MKWPSNEKKSRSITTLYHYRVLGNPKSVGTEDRPQVNMVLSSQKSNRYGIWDKVQVTAFGVTAKELLKEYNFDGKSFKVQDGAILTVEVINTSTPNNRNGGVYENHVLQEWTPVLLVNEAPVRDEKNENPKQVIRESGDEMMQFLFDTFR